MKKILIVAVIACAALGCAKVNEWKENCKKCCNKKCQTECPAPCEEPAPCCEFTEEVVEE